MIILKILTVMALLAWPMYVFMGIMIFDAPDSINNLSNIMFYCAIVFYPVYIAILYLLTKQNFLGMTPKIFLLVTFIACIGALFFFDVPRYAYNAARGIPSSVYYSDGEKAYFNGHKLDVDAKSFKIWGEYKSEWANDAHHVFYQGELLPEIDAQTFEQLEKNYAKDKTSVFFRGKKIEADSESFEIVYQAPEDEEREISELVDAKDKSRNYFAGRPAPLSK